MHGLKYDMDTSSNLTCRHGDASVNDQGLTSDVPRGIRSEEERGIGNVEGITHPVHGYLSIPLGDESLVISIGIFRSQSLDEWRVHEAWHHYIQPDAFWSVDDGSRSGELGLSVLAEHREQKDLQR